MDNYNELDWFFEKLQFDYENKKVIEQLNIFEAVLVANKYKQQYISKWVKEKNELVNKKFVYSKEVTLFDKLKLKSKNKTFTLFDKLKKLKNKK